MSLITLASGKLINPANIVSVYRSGNSIAYKFLDGKTIIESFNTDFEAELSVNVIVSLIDDYLDSALPIPFVDTNMQTLYGDADEPTVDPQDVDKPACYRGRTNNTVWFWDTGEKAWYPVVSAT